MPRTKSEDSHYLRLNNTTGTNMSESYILGVLILIINVLYIYACWYVQTFSNISILVKGCAIGIPLLFILHVLFETHGDLLVEMVPKGFSKGTGINRLCEIKGIDKEDTIAIGDAANDVEMFRAAGFSIAMGSGAEGAKEAADYVTTGLHDDGILNALKYSGLI